MPGAGDHPVEVVAEGLVDGCQHHGERGDEDDARGRRTHLETLREQECEQQEDGQPGRQYQADQIDQAHSRSTARASRARAAKSPSVSSTNTTSITERPFQHAIEATVLGRLIQVNAQVGAG
ncbi:hypothetical protein GCM10022225_54040 [Plantactinospora mayteni]|uniref:Uncharacterized protein n=1 Tax=Plantactinospora mayteni TaxID=566021 RepID=A0ABQ4EJW3_9ACTN|nr:hypothetical protein Pma05_15950 [Plantactinospora mayteni]